MTAGSGANGRIVSEVSTSSDDSDQDRVPALLSSGLSSFPEHCRRFKYRELEEATSGFSDELVIGEGGICNMLISLTPACSITVSRAEGRLVAILAAAMQCPNIRKTPFHALVRRWLWQSLSRHAAR